MTDIPNLNSRRVFSVTKKDLEVTWFSGTGAGGQYRNKHQNCCRVKHIATGVISTGQSSRSRSENMRQALRGLSENRLFRAYCFSRLVELEGGKSIEQLVEDQLQPNMLKYEAKEGGKWVETI